RRHAPASPVYANSDRSRRPASVFPLTRLPLVGIGKPTTSPVIARTGNFCLTSCLKTCNHIVTYATQLHGCSISGSCQQEPETNPRYRQGPARVQRKSGV